MDEDDPHDLQRFVAAQDPVFDAVCSELAAGTKRTHWMWFVFPQLRGLGSSPTARFYGIASLDEARAYWQHPVLGPRLAQCGALLAPHEGATARQILGSVDAMKLRSCLTLFEQAAPEEPLFGRLLDVFCHGERDAATLRLIASP
jgi:uncharacterized protein (DUF1810 family)